MVELHNGSILFAGTGTKNRKGALIFDSDITESYTQVQDMQYPRHHAACTLFYSAKHDYRPVVYVGGGCTSGPTSELLDYTVTDTWEKSK